MANDIDLLALNAAISINSLIDFTPSGSKRTASIQLDVIQAIRTALLARGIDPNEPLPPAESVAQGGEVAKVDTRRAPVQRYHDKTIPWQVHGLAWEAYAKEYGTSQSAERLAERGGFGCGEMDRFLPGWRDMAHAIDFPATPTPATGSGGDAVAWVVFDSKQDRYVIFNPELASAIAERGLLTLPVFGQYEWLDAKINEWKPINRLPYTWERELGIQWRAHPAQAGGEPE